MRCWIDLLRAMAHELLRGLLRSSTIATAGVASLAMRLDGDRCSYRRCALLRG